MADGAEADLTERLKRLLGALWLAFGPALLMSAFLFVSYGRLDHLWAGILMLVGASLGGLSGLLLLPVSRREAALIALIYLPAMALLLIVFSLYFVCDVFGECL